MEFLSELRLKLERRKMLKIQNRGIRTVRLGNKYGGFNVVDSMFLELNRKIVVYSFGIGEDLSFSEGVLSTFPAEVWAFDPTPKSIKYVE